MGYGLSGVVRGVADDLAAAVLAGNSLEEDCEVREAHGS